MRQWEQNKQRFIEAFGGKMIVELGEVEFHLSTPMRESKVNDFIDRLTVNYQHPELADFVRENRRGFFENRVVEGDDRIPLGMKLVRAFKYFESENKALLERIQNEASRIIQEDKFKGTLCISVHPLDFLSSSENDYKWRSCHALDGEYRSGNLSYMCDNATCLVYVKGKDDVILPHFPSDVPWNSKKWRTLLFLSEGADMLFAGRQYPFSTSDGMRTVGECLKSIPLLTKFFSNYWWEWDDFTVDHNDLYSRYIKIYHKLVALDEIITDCSSLHYNDLKWSNYSKPMYIPELNYAEFKLGYLPHFYIGAEVRCLHCGNTYIEDAVTMRCDDCELEYGTEDNDNYTYCDCCGIRLHWDDVNYITDDYRVCNDCFQEKGFICPQCGETIFAEDAVYYAPHDEYYCDECVEMFVENEKEKKHHGEGYCC